MDTEFFKDVLKRNGLSAVLICFFVWQGSIREQALYTRIEKLETYIQNRLEKLIENANEVIKENTSVIRRH